MKINLDKEIAVKREWLERLIQLGKDLQDNAANNFTSANIHYLCGYIESAESMLKL